MLLFVPNCNLGDYVIEKITNIKPYARNNVNVMNNESESIPAAKRFVW